MTNYKQVAAELSTQVVGENINEVVDLELINYETDDLVELCQSVQGEKHIFDDPMPNLNGDFDAILKQLAFNALTFLIQKTMES